VVRRSVVGIPIAVMLALTGCHLDPGPKKPGSAPAVRLSPMEVLAHVSQRVRQAGSFRLKTDITTMDDLESGVRVKARADIRSRPDAAQRWNIWVMTPAGRPKERDREIVLGNSLYLNTSAHVLPSRKPWFRFPLSRFGALTGLLTASKRYDMADPSTALTTLTVSKDIHEIGPETFDSVATTHYRGTFAISDALARLRARHRTSVLRFYEKDLRTLAFDVWVDERQLPRKVRITNQTGSNTTLIFDTVYTAFDRTVTITAPPRSQVFDGTRLGGRVPGVRA
jgi:hypothetical protein